MCWGLLIEMYDVNLQKGLPFINKSNNVKYCSIIVLHNVDLRQTQIYYNYMCKLQYDSS